VARQNSVKNSDITKKKPMWIHNQDLRKPHVLERGRGRGGKNRAAPHDERMAPEQAKSFMITLKVQMPEATKESTDLKTKQKKKHNTENRSTGENPCKNICPGWRTIGGRLCWTRSQLPQPRVQTRGVYQNRCQLSEPWTLQQ
jgi:hypothetical protein